MCDCVCQGSRAEEEVLSYVDCVCVSVCQGELDRANKEKEVVSSHNRHLEQRLTGGDSENGGATELERHRSQVEVSRPQGQRDQRSPEVIGCCRGGTRGVDAARGSERVLGAGQI